MSELKELKDLRIIIAGGRDFTDYDFLKQTMKEYFVSLMSRGYNVSKDSFTIVSGTARGADKLGEQFALENGLKLVRFPANWDIYGKRAGYIRNKEMAKFAAGGDPHGVLFAFWDGESKGTKHMIDLAGEYGVVVHIKTY